MDVHKNQDSDRTGPSGAPEQGNAPNLSERVAVLEAQSRHVATKADLKELEVKLLGQMMVMGDKMNAISVAMKDLQIRILATLTPTIVAVLTAFAVVSKLMD